ncbi:MAG: type II secretion system F family protein [bacterium]
MPVFKYQAKASPAEVVHGEMQAASVQVLVARLDEMGLYPLDISPVSEDQVLKTGHIGALFRKPTKTAVVLFTRQLANMLDAGMTLHAALSLLHKQTRQGSMEKVLHDLVERLRDGSRFSEACAAWPKVFSKFYVNMIRAGETGGMLNLVLEHLADFLEREDDVQKQIRVALAYPVLMLGMGVVTVSLLLTFVVPRIVSMFDEMGQTLPLPTKILVNVSGFFSHYWGLIFLTAIALLLAMRFKRKQPDFRLKIDRFKLRLPLLGSLQIQGEVTQFARTMSALLAHGVPIHQAFEVIVAACKNVVLQEEFRSATDAIRRGERIGSSLSAGQYLPALLGQMITIAEDTNQLEPVLEKIAKSGTREVERRVGLLTKLLEPAMIILIGAIIGFIVFAMMLPIFQMDFLVQ